MPKRFKLTRRFPCAMTEDGYRRLRRFAKEAGLDEGEALSAVLLGDDQALETHLLGHLCPDGLVVAGFCVHLFAYRFF